MKHYGIPGMHWGHRKSQTLNPYKELKKKEKQELKEWRKHADEVYKKTKHGVVVSKTARNGWPTQYINKKGETFTPKEVEDAWYRHQSKKDKIKKAISLTISLAPVAYAVTRPEFRSSVKQGVDFARSIDWKTIEYDAAQAAFIGIMKP